MQKLQIPMKKAVFIYLLTALFLCFEMGLQVSPSVMTNDLMHSLNISVIGLGFMSGFYFYTYTVMQIPAGLLFDRFQVRWVIVLPLLVCAMGAIVFSFAHTIWFGSFGRLLMGMGSAFAFIAVLVVASDLFDAKHFGTLAGVTLMLAAVGAMLGEAPLVPVLEYLGWRNTMRLLALIAVALSVLIAVFVRYEKCNALKTRQPGKKTNIFRSLKSIVSKPQTAFVAIYSCCVWAPMAAFASLWGVAYLETVYGLDKVGASEILSLMWIGLAVGSLLMGWLSDTFKTRRIPLVFCSALGFVCFYMVNLHWVLPFWLLGTLVFFVGFACAGQALAFAVVKDNNDEEVTAAAIGFNNMAVVIAGAIFQPLVAWLIDDESMPHFVQGIDVLVDCFLVATVLALFFIRSRRY
jgi:MFS family permease